MSDSRFTRDDRLRKQAEFDRVFNENAYAADGVLVVRGCANGGQKTRLGLSVSRKVGNAVVRNRWKRLVREAFRTQREQMPTGLDIVVRPRRGADPDFAAIARSLPKLADQLAKRLKKGR